MKEFDSMLIAFLVLSISFLVFTSVFFYHKIYRSSVCIICFLTVIELYTPALHYVILESKDYYVFSKEALLAYSYLSAVSFLVYAVIISIVQGATPPRFVVKGLPNVKNGVINVLAGLVILILLCYLVIYREGLPVYQAIANDVLIKRPDTTGAIPHWFTISAIICYVIPSFFLYYHTEEVHFKKYSLVYIIVIAILMLMGGNKGFVLFWIAFVWIYLWKYRGLSWVILFGLAISGAATVIQSGSAAGFSIERIYSGFQYGISRLTLTQGAMLVSYIELVLQDFDWDYLNYTKQVFYFIYGYLPDSAPSYYLGSLLVFLGFWSGYIAHLVVFFLVICFGRYIDLHVSSHHIMWLFYCFQYQIGMAGIGLSFLYRTILLLGIGLCFMLIKEKT